MANAGSEKLHPLKVGLAVTVLLTLVVHGLSAVGLGRFGQDAVTIVLLGATYLLVLRRESAVIRHYGLDLGGVLEPEPLDKRRIGASAGRAVGWALLAAIVFFPPYAFAYVWWWQPRQAFELAFTSSISEGAAEVVGQWLMVGIPEEMFYRGYLQTAFDDRSARRFRLWGAELGPGLVYASALFAVGHFLTVPNPARLSVFLPALAFGFLRQRTGGIGAAALFHALCNLFALLLGRSYGLVP